ncbi:IS66 family insertion sequence element accessory protein TnpB [Alicyclobacillus vulcanalis]|uniref:IS66 family insertion sequence element accessory protein TnpB n=1 Tax=Alicyclobacillus vulcanalis TaxID=252246 RepID=UPI000970A968
MLTEWATEGRVYLACGATDMRKSIDGLAALVQEQFQLDPFSPCLFVFCNRQRDKFKIPHKGPQRLLGSLSTAGTRPISVAH